MTQNQTEVQQKHLPAGSLLEHLAPPPEYQLDHALCASYSAQTSVLAAMLLALRGNANDNGRSSRILLAKAMKELRGKVHFLLQEGRIGAPATTNCLPAMLDRFVLPMKFRDGKIGQSWHPKICIVRYVPLPADSKKPLKPPIWKLWLGSRNFTKDDSWDLALYLTSSAGGRGGAISGVSEAVQKLATCASLDIPWESLIPELERVKWITPVGLTVKQIMLSLPTEKGNRIFPAFGSKVKSVLGVSPFLDDWGVKELALGAGTAEIALISTRSAFEKCGQRTRDRLGKFSTLYQLADTSEDGLEADEDDVAPDASPEPRGLHAKFLWLQREQSDMLILGSPNLTQRGWKENAEVHAVIQVSHASTSEDAQQLRAGIAAFRQRCGRLELASLPETLKPDATATELEACRGRLAYELTLGQRLGTSGEVEVIGLTSLSLPPGMHLAIGRIGDARKTQMDGQVKVVLPDGPVESNSDLVCLELVLKGQILRWLQSACFSPGLGDARDIPLLETYLGLNGIMEWLAEELSAFGVATAHAGDWGHSSTYRPQDIGHGISVEAVLSGWQRKGQSLGDIPKILAMAISAAAKLPADDKNVIQLRSFEKSWRALKIVLGGKAV